MMKCKFSCLGLLPCQFREHTHLNSSARLTGRILNRKWNKKCYNAVHSGEENNKNEFKVGDKADADRLALHRKLNC